MLMNKQTLLYRLQSKAESIWEALAESHLALVRLNPPQIKLNGRLYRTAGRCFQDLAIVEIGSQFFGRSHEWDHKMYNVILPHEIIHYADWVLYGESEAKCGHGKGWRKLMLEYGLPDNPYHDMWIEK